MLSAPRKFWIVVLLLLVGSAALVEWRHHWRHIAVATAPEKTPRISETPLAQEAKAYFWSEFLAGNYGQIPEILRLLVKQGRVEVAQRIYGFARLSKTYEQWPYRDLLERSILEAPERAQQFKAAKAGTEPAVMINSDHACTGCHAAGPT